MGIRRSLSRLVVVLASCVALYAAASVTMACNTAELQPEGPIMPVDDFNLDAGDDGASPDAATVTVTPHDAATTAHDAASDDDASDAS